MPHPDHPVERRVQSLLEPGQWVRHPGRPDWGDGQVQSVAGSRVTVNFEHEGKVLINAQRVALEPLSSSMIRSIRSSGHALAFCFNEHLYPIMQAA